MRNILIPTLLTAALALAACSNDKVEGDSAVETAAAAGDDASDGTATAGGLGVAASDRPANAEAAAVAAQAEADAMGTAPAATTPPTAQ